MMQYVARTEKNSGSNSKHIYNLYAVSNHYGTMESGHYTGEHLSQQRDRRKTMIHVISKLKFESKVFTCFFFP